MKKTTFISIAILASIFLAGCAKKGCTDPAANNYDANATSDDGFCTYDDPAGTASIVIGKDCTLQNGMDFSKGIVECADCGTHMDSTSSDIIYDVTKFLVAFPDSACWGSENLRIISLGLVNDLGAIHKIPDSNNAGWGKTAAPALGHGYVVQTREGKLARFYIRKLVQDAITGAVIGADLKYQYPFE